MAGNFGDVEPVRGIEGARQTGGEYDQGERAPAGPPAHGAIRGVITHVRERTRQQDGQGRLLDVTVGGEDHTEITIRLPEGHYGNLEGRRVVIYIEEDRAPREAGA